MKDGLMYGARFTYMTDVSCACFFRNVAVGAPSPTDKGGPDRDFRTSFVAWLDLR